MNIEENLLKTFTHFDSHVSNYTDMDEYDKCTMLFERLFYFRKLSKKMYISLKFIIKMKDFETKVQYYIDAFVDFIIISQNLERM